MRDEYIKPYVDASRGNYFFCMRRGDVSFLSLLYAGPTMRDFRNVVHVLPRWLACVCASVKVRFIEPRAVTSDRPGRQTCLLRRLESWRSQSPHRGLLGGTRCELHYCKFGVHYQKPTLIWTNIESLIEALTADGKKHKHICCDEHPCAFREQGHERLGRDGPTCNEASAFPPDLVTFLNDHIMNETCAHRRNDDVKA